MSMGQVLYQLPADLIVEEEGAGHPEDDERTAGEKSEDDTAETCHYSGQAGIL